MTPPFDRSLDHVGLLPDEAIVCFPGQPRFLYGHSMDGNLVLTYALRRRSPTSGVVATSPFLRPGFKPSNAGPIATMKRTTTPEKAQVIQYMIDWLDGLKIEDCRLKKRASISNLQSSICTKE